MSDPISWAPEVMVIDNGDKWSRNQLRFATKEEAERSAHGLFQRWTLCVGWRAAPADEAVNYRIDGNVMVRV